MDAAATFVDTLIAAFAARETRTAWSPGDPGYSLPRFKGQPILVPGEDAATLARFGITLEGDPGRDNLICLDALQPPLSLVLRLRDCTGTRIVIGNSHPFGGRVAFNGIDSMLVVAGVRAMGGASGLRLTLGPGCAAYLGAGLTSVSSDWVIEGEGSSLVVGDDLMASWGIFVRNFDSHALFDLNERRVINKASDLHIAPHCWIGQDARLVRGVEIGAGSVVGAASVVTADVPAASAVAGSPARVVRSGVSWTRNPRPSAAEMERVANMLRAHEAARGA